MLHRLDGSGVPRQTGGVVESINVVDRGWNLDSAQVGPAEPDAGAYARRLE